MSDHGSGKAMSEYQKRRQACRQRSIDWLQSCSENAYGYGEIAEQRETVERIARRYGLRREFSENGII